MAEKLKLAREVTKFLNQLVEIDRSAVAALVANRVPCNDGLASHPTVQVAKQPGGYHVGLLGVLNGLCGVKPDGRGFIEARFEDQDGEFPGLIGFEVLDPGEEA